MEPSAVDRDSRAAARAGRGDRARAARRLAELRRRDGGRGGRVRPPRRRRSSTATRARRRRRQPGHRDAAAAARARARRSRRCTRRRSRSASTRTPARSPTPRPRPATSRRWPPACGSARTRSSSPATCAARSQPEQRDLLRGLDARPQRARDRGPARGDRRGGARRWLRGGRVGARVARRRRRRLGRALPLGRDGGTGARGRAQPHARAVRWTRRSQRSAAAATRRRPRRSCASDDRGEVLERVLAEVERVAQAPLRARRGDVAARCTPSRATTEIAATLVECQRLGLSGIQVSENGDLTGVVSREDLDRAVRHGLSHAPVKGVMSAGVPVIGGDATLGELRELLAGGRPGGSSSCRGPVPRGGAGAAASGRGRRHARRRAARAARAGERSSARLRTRRRRAAVRARLGRDRAPARGPARDRRRSRRPFDGVYLVGGAVRDVLLGEQSLDLDLMVEGDAIAFARAAGARSSASRPPAREVPDRGREGHRRARPRDPGRRRERAHRVLRRAGRAARGRALDAAPRPRAARLHDQRDGDVAEGRRPRAPPTTSSAATATCARHGARAAQPQLRRGPDAPAARDPLRGAARVPHGRAHAVAGARLHRDAAGRRPFLGAAARRAARPAGRAATCARRSSAWPSWASTARCTRTSTRSRRGRPRGVAPSAAMQAAACRGAPAARAAGLPVRRAGGPRGVRVARAASRSAAATRTSWPRPSTLGAR